MGIGVDRIAPDVFVTLDVNFVELLLARLVGDVGLHLHGDVPGQHRQQQPLLLLVLPLRDEARLDAVARFEEGASLRQLARVVRHDAGRVAGQERRQRAAHLQRWPRA